MGVGVGGGVGVRVGGKAVAVAIAGAVAVAVAVAVGAVAAAGGVVVVVVAAAAAVGAIVEVAVAVAMAIAIVDFGYLVRPLRPAHVSGVLSPARSRISSKSIWLTTFFLSEEGQRVGRSGKCSEPGTQTSRKSPTGTVLHTLEGQEVTYLV